MSIDQKLSELEIKRILVVDDIVENVLAAKQAFAKYTNASIEYAASAKKAIEKIKLASEQGQKYDLVISDLEMETKTAGLDVVKEAILKKSYATIATGANYDRSETDGHGPTTTIRPSGASIKSKKDKPEVWDFVMEKSLDYIAEYKESQEFSSLQRIKHIEKMPELMLEQMMDKYTR